MGFFILAHSSNSKIRTTFKFDFVTRRLFRISDPKFIIAFFHIRNRLPAEQAVRHGNKICSLTPIYDCGTGDTTYISNCIALDTEHDCAKYVQGHLR